MNRFFFSLQKVVANQFEERQVTGMRFGDFFLQQFGELGGTGFQAAPIYAKYCFPGVKG